VDGWLLHWYLVIMTTIVSHTTSPTLVNSFVPTLPGKNVLVCINVANLNNELADDQDWYDSPPDMPLLFPLFN